MSSKLSQCAYGNSSMEALIGTLKRLSKSIQVTLLAIESIRHLCSCNWTPCS